MIYSIRLTITHIYAHRAANGRHLVRVLPRMIAQRQHLTTHLVEIIPLPDARRDTVDFFGNTTTSCAHTAPHDQMAIKLACHVEVIAPPLWEDQSPALEELRAQWGNSRDLGAHAPVHFLGPSPRVTPDAAITDFARQTYDQTASVAQNVIAIGRALYDEMTFDATATTVDTDAGEAFRLRRGVCQDLTNIMILALQALGIPAGYVSGYLRTLPPLGGVKLAGADAMHAWVRAWCGDTQGWIEYDPTNARLVGSDHIVVGFGRDYGDVAPVAGQLRAGGAQVNSQAVDVTLVG